MNIFQLPNGIPPRLEPKQAAMPAVTNIPDADRESAISSYGESFQADSPDPKDYFGR
jgi:hypothetical protein